MLSILNKLTLPKELQKKCDKLCVLDKKLKHSNNKTKQKSNIKTFVGAGN